MHDDRAHVELRIRRALSQRIQPAVHAKRRPLTLTSWQAPGEPVPADEALAAEASGEFRPIRIGQSWGAPWSTTWLRLHGRVPTEWSGHRIEVIVDLGFNDRGPGFQAEGLMYNAAGVPIKGVTPRNNAVTVAAPSRGEEVVDLFLEAAANPVLHDMRVIDGVRQTDFSPTALGDILTAGTELQYVLRQADLAVLDEQVWHLGLDIEVLSSLMFTLAVADPRRHEILRAIERALDVLDEAPAGPAGVSSAAEKARSALEAVLARPAHASAHRVTATGHAHIDTAWLWPIRETKRKCARTFASVTDLAKAYPELVFACSSAQQYEWVREEYPEVFDRMLEATAAGNWVPVGGMWVESDANMPSGESLARQLIHGTRYFLDRFDVRTRDVWLPDSFGYTASFPQIARLSGAQWFLTQKLSWNATNKFPHHTFWWEGLDGTRIFTHMPPVDAYDAELSSAELAHAVANYAEKGQATRSLVPFGYGDGGGGPTREMLERARRLRDLEGSPRVEVAGPGAFFEAARTEYPDAPVWSGELYLEAHRGTYTSQQATKAGNRRGEALLREAELWCTTAEVRSRNKPHSYAYPHEDLDRLWKIVLLHQFHDILPGSSIGWVHREAEGAYLQVAEELEDIIDGAVRVIAEPAWTGAGDPARVLLNAASRPRREVALITGAPHGRVAEQPAAMQRTSSGLDAVWVDLPALAAVTLDTARAVDAPAPVTVAAEHDGHVLSNGLLRIRVDRSGLIRSVLDVTTDRDAVAPGGVANLLQIHPDRPAQWDAWDLDAHYRHSQVDLTELAPGTNVQVVDDGPLIASLRCEREIPGTATRLTQTVQLRAGSRRIEFTTAVDWLEDERVLKAAFALDVHAERVASEVAFGYVYRPTSPNTSWDAAQYETSAHRWVHAGERGFAVALLTESTYGHDARRTPRLGGGSASTVRLTLLRSPRYPDPTTDRGRQRLRYHLLVGANIATTVAEAYAVAHPVRAVSSGVPGTQPEEGPGPQVPPAPGVAPALVSLDAPEIVVDTVKLADDRSGDVIVRLFECSGGRATGTLTIDMPWRGASICDLLEDPLRDADLRPQFDVSADGVMLVMRAFQVATVRIHTSTVAEPERLRLP